MLFFFVCDRNGNIIFQCAQIGALKRDVNERTLCVQMRARMQRKIKTVEGGGGKLWIPQSGVALWWISYYQLADYSIHRHRHSMKCVDSMLSLFISFQDAPDESRPKQKIIDWWSHGVSNLATLLSLHIHIRHFEYYESAVAMCATIEYIFKWSLFDIFRILKWLHRPQYLNKYENRRRRSIKLFL